jgi:hypothetical protein
LCCAGSAEAQKPLNPAVRASVGRSPSQIWFGGHLETPPLAHVSARVVLEFGAGTEIALEESFELLDPDRLSVHH